MRQKIYQYTAIFELNENGGYTATVPALPGLITEGKDLAEARLMAIDAIKCYVEGLNRIKEEAPKEKEVAQMRLTVEV